MTIKYNNENKCSLEKDKVLSTYKVLALLLVNSSCVSLLSQSTSLLYLSSKLREGPPSYLIRAFLPSLFHKLGLQSFLAFVFPDKEIQLFYSFPKGKVFYYNFCSCFPKPFLSLLYPSGGAEAKNACSVTGAKVLLR